VRYVEVLFTIAMAVHISAGVLACLVIFPLQIFGPKRQLHRRVGRLGVVVAWIIAISGFAMLANPLFSSFWSEESESLGIEGRSFQAFFAEMTYEPLFFLYLDVILLYLVVTGVGTWARVAAGTPDGAVPPRTADKVWNAVMLIVLLSQVALGLVDLGSDSLYTFASLAVAVVMLAVVLCDVLTWRDQGRRVKRWWLLHGGKLFTAWGGLVYAVSLRWRMSQGLEGRTDTLLPLLLVLGLGAVVAFGVHQAYRNRLEQPAVS